MISCVKSILVSSFVFLWCSFYWVSAAVVTDSPNADPSLMNNQPALQGAMWADPTKQARVFTTEKIPWADCDFVGENDKGVLIDEKTATPENRKYECKVPEASSAIKSVISTMIQYVVFIATLCGVLMLAVWWIMYSIGGATDEGKVKAKKFIVSSIAGLILLFFVSAILYLVAPWVYS